jgi:hypothetical protein
MNACANKDGPIQPPVVDMNGHGRVYDRTTHPDGQVNCLTAPERLFQLFGNMGRLGDNLTAAGFVAPV